MANQVLVEISARHVHVSQADLETLFGKGYELTVKKMLSQPGQFACEERVRVIGPKGEFPRVSILGPVRKDTQVELSLTDARSIGVTAPVRESGDVKGSDLQARLKFLTVLLPQSATFTLQQRMPRSLVSKTAKSFLSKFRHQTKETSFSAMWFAVFQTTMLLQCILIQTNPMPHVHLANVTEK